MTKNGKRWPGGVKVRKRNKNARQQARRNEKLTERLNSVAVASQSAAKGMKAMQEPLSELASKISKAAAPYGAISDRSILEGMTVAELRVLCENREIKTTTKMRKPQLIEMLVGR